MQFINKQVLVTHRYPDLIIGYHTGIKMEATLVMVAFSFLIITILVVQL